MAEIIQIPNTRQVFKLSDYNVEIIDGELILTPKKISIKLDEFDTIKIKNSVILECLITDNTENLEFITNSIKYRSIIVDIWKTMPTNQILQNTSFNFKLTDENEKGYNWCSVLNMSFQNKDSI